MSSIEARGGDITPLIDVKKTFGDFLFVGSIRDVEEFGEDGERGEVTAIRCEVLSTIQKEVFRVKIDLSENPYASFDGLKMDDPIELINLRVYERVFVVNNNDGNRNRIETNVVVTIEADDVVKVEKKNTTKVQTDVSVKDSESAKRDQKKNN